MTKLQVSGMPDMALWLVRVLLISMGRWLANTSLELRFWRAIAGLALADFSGLDVGVDCARDGQVSPSGLVLIDDRGALAVAASLVSRVGS